MAGTTLDSAPQEIRDLFHKGLGAMERGNFDYAINIFFMCLEKDPLLTDIRKYLYVSEIRKFKAGKPENSAHFMSTLMGIPLLVQAWISMNTGAFMKTLMTMEKLLKEDPLNVEFIKLYCKAALAADMPELAIQVLATAREHYPANVFLLSWLGELYMNANQPEDARDCYQSVVNLRPHDGAALKALKDSMAMQSLTKDGWATAGTGKTSYRDMMKDTKEATVLEQQAKAVRSQVDNESLIEDAKAKILREPGNVNYYRHLANLYINLKQFDSAISTLRQAQDLRGSADPEIDTTISATTLKKFDYEIAELTNAGNREGSEELRQQRNDFFFNDIQARVNKYPNDLNLRYELGVAFHGRNMFNDAIQQFQLSQKNPRWHIKSLYYLGLCFRAKEQYDLAIEQLERAASELISMDTAKKDVYYEMGLIKEAMGDHEGALAHFKEIYQVDIGYKDIARRVEQGYKR